MDPVGIIYASIKNPRISEAATVAKTMASAHSRTIDFLYGYLILYSLKDSCSISARFSAVNSTPSCAAVFRFLAYKPFKKRTLLSFAHIGSTIKGTKTAAAFSQKRRLPKQWIKSRYRL